MDKSQYTSARKPLELPKYKLAGKTYLVTQNTLKVVGSSKERGKITTGLILGYELKSSGSFLSGE